MKTTTLLALVTSGILLATFFILPLLSPAASDNYRVEEWPMAFHDLRHTGYTSASPPERLGSEVKLKWRFATESWVYSSPAVVDIDNDGNMEVVFGSSDGKLYAISGESGGLE